VAEGTPNIPYHPYRDPYKNVRTTSISLRNAMHNCADLNHVSVSVGKGHTIHLFSIDGMVDIKAAQTNIIKPLLNLTGSPFEILDGALKGGIHALNMKKAHDLSDALSGLLAGLFLIVSNEVGFSVLVDMRAPEHRSITEPTSENIIKGSKDCFVENLRTNTATLRQKIRSADLKFEEFTVGRRTNTTVALTYMDGIANDSLISSIREKIESIDIDRLISASDFETYLVDENESFFPRYIFTEMVDRFAGGILDGKVGVIIHGLPIAYIIPSTLPTIMRTTEDLQKNYLLSSTIIILRYLALFISLVFPAFYVAVSSFSQEMIPTDLLLSIIASKSGVPFDTFTEVLILLVAFELLFEAGLRLPNPIGQSVSIIGTLIVGQATVDAKLMSPIVIIVIALSGISSFILPNQDLSAAIRLCRFALLFGAAVAGLYAIVILLCLLVYHLVSLETFGVPYLTPISSSSGANIRNSAVLKQLQKNVKFRNLSVKPKNVRRQK